MDGHTARRGTVGSQFFPVPNRDALFPNLAQAWHRQSCGFDAPCTIRDERVNWGIARRTGTTLRSLREQGDLYG
jgi:hypothetical protein